MHSLRSRLFVLWVLSLAASTAVAWLLLDLYQQSTQAQVQRAEAVVARACDQIRDRFAFYATGWTGPMPAADDPTFRRDLASVVTVALSRAQGVEGGVWQSEAGALAYAFPTYQGSAPKTDFPQAEREPIRAINEEALAEDQAVAHRSVTDAQTQLLFACPLGGPVQGLTAWTMARVQQASGFDQLRLGLGVLAALVLGMSAWLGWLTVAWARQAGGLARALAGGGGAGPAQGGLPRVARTGDPDLDRVVEALNLAGERADRLADQMATAARLAALGRVAAGVAHEIRNPIAAMRLRAENALAGDDARRVAALGAIIGQVGRLDQLTAELLAMTQRRTPAPRDTDLAALLTEAIEDHRALAKAGGVALRLDTTARRAILDPDLLRRALDNLVLNAIQHTPPGGSVTVSATAGPCLLRLEVADTGPGIAPDLRGSLFEPFITGRAEGTGLGLAIARELTEAQGGRLTLRHPGGEAALQGAAFVLELPWRAS